MKRLLIGCAALMAVASTSAFAADVSPVFKAPPPGAVPYSWTGLYGGLNAGYSWGRAPFSKTESGIPITSGTLSPDSFIGGGQFGYNFQSGSIVFGVEGDIAWRNGSDAATFVAPNGFTTNFRDQQDWVGTLRPRVGIANDNWLFYGTAGLAYGSVKHSLTEAQPAVAGAARSVSDSSTQVGWTAGGGIEYAPSNRWSLGLEYLYQDLGKSTLSQPAQTISGVNFAPAATTFEDRSHVVRAKLNVKFGWDGPSVTR
jgi:outer membrane immunogenic protein